MHCDIFAVQLKTEMSGNKESRKDSVHTSGPSDNLVEETLLHIFLSCRESL